MWVPGVSLKSEAGTFILKRPGSGYFKSVGKNSRDTYPY